MFCQEAFGDIDHGEQSCQEVREALERVYESAREAFETVLVCDRIGRRVVLSYLVNVYSCQSAMEAFKGVATVC